MKKRIIALLIVCVLLVSLLPVVPTLAYGNNSIELPRNNTVGETVTVSADASGCQWQVKIGESWVNISGATNSELTLSYAMFANLPGAPVIRCIDASGNAVSDEIIVNFVDAVHPAPQPAPAPEVLTQPVVDAVITEPSGAPVVQQPVVQQPAAQPSVQDTAALEQAVADAKTANYAAQAAAAAAQAEADAKKAVLDAAQAEYDVAAANVAAAQAALDASIVTPAEGEEPAPVDANLSAALSTAKLAAADAEAKLAAAKAEYEPLAAAASEAANAAAATAAALADAQAALDAAKVAPAAAATETPKLKMASFNLAKNAAAPAADEPGTLTTYNVIINYLFENNETVADSYTAQLAAGSNFSATVTFPTVQGYLPYVGDVQKNSHEINIQNIQESTTITVVYKPTDVNYTVIHYQQNVDNDNYAEVARETLTGKTNSTVPEVAKSYPGFFALLYEKPTIAADASTVVEIYYDREYYLMNFELDGGYGTEPVYARYGAPIGTVLEPTKAGYTFLGWAAEKGGTTAVDVPSTMPADGATYYAIWEEGESAKVTIVFWGENANDEDYSYIKSSEIYTKPDSEFTYSEDGSLICGITYSHVHSADCGYACGKEAHVHNLESCYELNCTRTSHTHTDACIGCGHEHSYRCGFGFLCSHHNDSCYTCGQTSGSHTHSIANGCYTSKCTEEEHTHSENCGYSCNQHVHTSSCYMSGAGMDATRWVFKESDTVTVAPDGSTVVNVYYDRVEYVVGFYQNQNCSSNQEYTAYRITAKWGSSILDQWPTHNGSSSWLVQGKSNTWQNSIQIMPVGGAKFWGPKSGNSSYTAYYFVEALPGDSDTFEYNNVTYKLHHTDTSSSSGNVTDEERYGIEGFTYKEGTKNGQSYSNAKFYYTRNSYELTFNDGYDDVKSESVKFEAPLSTYSSYTPDVPAAYEPGSVVFGGWYLNPECTGKEYKLDEHTMPASNVLLYAKWVPVKHTVEFYQNEDSYNAGVQLETHPAVTVDHGSKLESVPETPKYGSYDFVGWFYKDEDGTEKAFDFANMPIREDMKVYAKWSSNVLKEYTVYFKIQDTDTEIADPISGSGVAGHTKTFAAKANTDLYAGYQEGYFPLVTSHSMILDVNGTEENKLNDYTFWYVQKDAVPYTVYYVTESYDSNRTPIELDGKTYYIVADTKTVSDNRKAVVTEKFEPVTGMMPDAYQKRLVVSGVEGAENMIVFIYKEDTTHAYYKITHYTENVGGEGWTEYASSQAVGDIGSTYSAEPMEIKGFTYDKTVEGTLTSGTLTANGLELKLYYVRNEYPYMVRYLEEGTGKQLADPKNGTAEYEAIVKEDAISIENYDVVGDSSKSISIRIEEDKEAKLNVITFYYKEKEVTINYMVVGPDNCGIITLPSETLKVVSGEAQGSTAAPAENYRFVGWYSDKECTKLVSSELNFVPEKVDGKNVAATYYAKFEYDLTTLTINKSGAPNRGYGSDGFIFTVSDSNGVVATVAISGNGSTTIGGLKVGTTYTVSEVSNWSGLYSCADQSVTLKPDGNEVTMENSFSGTNLLNGGDSVTNRPKN